MSPPRRRVAGRALQRIRADWFARFPLCVHCLRKGITEIARELDHIVALENGGTDFDADDGRNRQGLCIPCHRQKTDEDMKYRPSGACGVDGLPTDPRHSWNRQ